MNPDADIPPGKSLCVFLSNGGSLGHWQELGILSRELELYLTYIEMGIFAEVKLFSYDAADHALLADLRQSDPRAEHISLLTPSGKGRKSGLSGVLAGLASVRRHRKAIAASDFLKTNQVSGSWCAAYAHKLTGTPLMMRQGYSLSRRFAKNNQKLKSFLAGSVENTVYAMAGAIVVTSEDAAASLREDPSIAAKVHLVPTFVDMDAFIAKTDYAFNEPAIYVGRLEPQKNLVNLVRACGQAGIPLELVGKGSQDALLRETAAACGADIRFLGTIPNEQLARLLPSRSVFVLPSLHEGLPKVMIEAMACGMVCVGSPIPGTMDLISDGKTGYLSAGFEPDDLAATLTRAFGEKRGELGQAARAFVQETFSLAAYARSEGRIFDSMAPDQAHP